MSPRNSESVDSRLKLFAAFQMQDSNLQVAESAEEQSTSSEQNPSNCTEGPSNVPSTSVVPLNLGAAWAPQLEPEDKRRLIQLQLVLLLHARKCKINDNKANGEVRQCNLPNCATMKDVLTHMSTCRAGRTCTAPHCASSSQIISHWKNCTTSDCPVCVPLKQAAANRNQVIGGAHPTIQSNQYPTIAEIQRAYNVLGLSFYASYDDLNFNSILQRSQTVTSASNVSEPLPNCSSPNMNSIRTLATPTQQQNIQQNQLQMRLPLQNQSSATETHPNTQNFLPNESNVIPNNTFSKELHQTVGQELRQHLVQKMVQIIFPTVDLTSLRDPRMMNRLAYAEKVENDVYMLANTREEYYQFLAETIYEIQKEIEEKFQLDVDIQGQQQEVGPSLEPLVNNTAGTASPKLPVLNAFQLQLPGSSNSEPNDAEDLKTIDEEQNETKVEVKVETEEDNSDSSRKPPIKEHVPSQVEAKQEQPNVDTQRRPEADRRPGQDVALRPPSPPWHIFF